MYHFSAENIAEPLVLSERDTVPGTTCQYLKSFQIRAIRFLHEHYRRRQACILNDETGLGKCVTVSAFLGAIARKRKCLIIAQNDEEIVMGWQFHLSLFSNLSVEVTGLGLDICLILSFILFLCKGCVSSLKYNTSFDHNIFIIKWIALRDFEDLSKIDFDFIAIDNRGSMLSNNFCVGVLLKYYEKKVNLVISSVDVTSDLNLLHKVLRLCGLLNYQYLTWRAFEEKFNLPNLNDVSTNKADLEDYFLKREMLCDFCKDFRLRQYRHQFPGCLPLVDKNRYKNNLIAWKQHKDKKIRSSTSPHKMFGSSEEKSTEELFKKYIKSRKEMGLSDESTNIIARESVDTKEKLLEESIITSPTLFCTESGTEGDAKCDGQNIEAASPKHNTNKTEKAVLANKDNNTKYMGHLDTKLTELIPICDRSVENAPESTCSSSPSNVRKLRSRSIKLEKSSEKSRKGTKRTTKFTQNKNKSTEQNLKKNEGDINAGIISTVSKRLFDQNSKIGSKINARKLETEMYVGKSSEEILLANLPNKNTEFETTNLIDERYEEVPQETIDNCMETYETTKRPSRKTDAPLWHNSPLNINLLNKSLNASPTKQQNMNKSIDLGKISQFPTKVNINETKKVLTSGLCEHAIHPSGVHTREARPILEKDMHIDFVPNINKKNILPQKKAKQTSQELVDTRGVPGLLKEKVCENNPTTSVVQLANTDVHFTVHAPRLSNEESDLLSSEYEEIQCGQRLTPLSSASSEYTQTIFKRSYAFLIPPTPSIRNSEQLAFCHIADSELAIVQPSNPTPDIIVLSSSQDENSLSTQSSVSRRTHVLKRKDRLKPTNSRNFNDSTPTFREVLFKPNLRSVTKSPDLFSNYSDTDMACSQINDKSPFEGFKIFGSEVKQIQDASSSANSCRERTCLLRPREKHENTAASVTTQNKKRTSSIHPYNEATIKNTSEQSIKSACVDEDLIFEITKNCTFGSMMRITQNGIVSPVQELKLKSTQGAQHNRITNYLINAPQSRVDTFDKAQFLKTPSKSQLRASSVADISNSGTMASRKSPKSKSNTQSTKLTKWFGKHNTPTQKRVGEKVSEYQ